MFSNQSPGPDGLNPTFYKRFWNLYGLDIFSVATSWLEQDFIPVQENQNSIVLIPKINNPKIMRDYRLASHCNILYKIISKTLASRLRPLLQNVYPMNNLLWLKADPFLIMHWFPLNLFTIRDGKQKARQVTWISKSTPAKNLIEPTGVIFYKWWIKWDFTWNR